MLTLSDDLRRILVVKMSSIGDVVHSLPLLCALRKRFPSIFIGWVVDRRCIGVLENNPYIDRLFVFEREKWGSRRRFIKTPFEVLELMGALKKHRFQLVMDLQGLFRSGLISYLSGAPFRMGFANAREMSTTFYNVKIGVPEGKKLHAVERYMLMGRELGIETYLREFPLEASAYDAKRVESLLDTNEVKTFHRIVLINPWARWESKRWPLKKFALLADTLNCEADIRVLILGAKGDLDDYKRMASLMQTKVISLAGMTSLAELIYLMKRADILITNDSGPMHISAAVGTPVVALFGPTDPSLCGPHGEGHVVIKKELPCSFCHMETCPLEHECMTSISVGEVIAQARSKLNALHKSN